MWFQDEARVGQQGTLTRVWAKTGSRPRALRDMRFESAYIFGAICPQKGKAEAIVVGQVGKKEREEHLKAMSERVDLQGHAVVLTDRAPWHKSMKVPENMTIMHIPSYSPELNSTENVWDYLRSNYLSNRAFENFDEVVDACCEAWNKFADIPELICSVGYRDWASVEHF